MDLQRINKETLLIAAILVIAIFLRFYNLGAAPLTDEEAKWSLQALQVSHLPAHKSDLVIGPQPGYVFLTGALFSLLGGSNFLARFWPALSGSLLVVLPYFFRRDLGRYAALIMSAGLAIDPGLVTVSRQAGGPMMAVSFSLLAVGCWRSTRIISSGILSGLALLSGPAIITGIIGALLALVSNRFTNKKLYSSDLTLDDANPTEDLSGELSRNHGYQKTRVTRAFLIATSATILLTSTFFFQYPQGLEAWFNTLPTYIQGWISPSGVPALQLLAALFIFEIFATFFGILGSAYYVYKRHIENKLPDVKLNIPILWMFITLAILLLYPSRQVSDLIWVLVPLWALSAWLLQLFIPDQEVDPVSTILAGFVFILSALFWNSLLTPDQYLAVSSMPQLDLRLALSAGIFSITALAVILVSLGWSWPKACNGMVWGFSLASIIYMLAVTWSATQLRPNEPQELWNPDAGIDQEQLLIETIQDLSNAHTGTPFDIEIGSAVNAPSIVWLLRDFPNVSYNGSIETGNLSPLIITREEAGTPLLDSVYRGQDFSWWIKPAWNSGLPFPIIKWITFRQAPIAREKLILWAKSDLFPNSAQEIEKELIEVIE